MSRALRALFVVAAVLVASAPPASAGTYDVWSCAGPTWAPAPIAGWASASNGAPPASNQCATSQGLRAEFQATAAPASSSTGWTFQAPAGTTIASYELFRAARGGTAADGTDRAYALYHDEPRFDPDVFMFEFCTWQVQGCSKVGDPDAPSLLDPDNRVSRSGLRIRRLILRMECRAAGSVRDCAAANPPGSLAIGRARIGLADDAVPTLSAPTGPLVTAGALLEGAQGVTVEAEDAGGGVERFDVLVDGASVGAHALAEQRASCRVPYVELIPCPRAARASFAFDTTSVANGSHSIQIAAVDAAGNRTLSPAVVVWILNGATANGAGASRGAHVAVAFARGRRTAPRHRVTTRYGGTRAVRGRLTDAQGQPIAGARLEIVATERRAGAKPRVEGSATTGADGRFRYMPRRGPSRRLRFDYRAFSLDPKPSASGTVVLGVRAGIRLAVRPRRTTSRGTIRFRGRLLGGPARAGVQVALYAVGREARSRVPVAVLTTDAGGRFRYRYQFLRTFAPFTYRFVARVERQQGYPYAAGSSATATVRVVR